MTSEQHQNCDIAVHNNQNDAFTRSLANRLKFIDGKDTTWIDGKHHENNINELYVISSPPQEIDATDDYVTNLKHNIGSLNEFELLLQDNYECQNDINDNTIKHAGEFELAEFECIRDITIQDLIIKEVLDDVLLRAFTISDEHADYDLGSDDVDDDEDSCEIPRVRRCSSLKTGKTPPGTPACKKIVRFADVLGLDLADVRTYLDEIPKVPLSAYKDLGNCDVSDGYHACPTQLQSKNSRTLLALFQQPASNANFIGKVTVNMVALENAFLADSISFCIKGVVRVRNLDYNKSVHVRFTMDSWTTSSDLQGNYVPGSSDGFTDKFAFTIYGYALEIGERLEFAVRFQCKGEQYWDNNNGNNYCFQCLPSASPLQPFPMTAGLNEHFTTFYYTDRRGSMEKAIANDDEDAEGDKSMEAVCDNKEPSAMIMNAMSSMEVQEYITRSLNKNKVHLEQGACSNPKPEVMLFFLILFLSIIMLYLKKALM